MSLIDCLGLRWRKKLIEGQNKQNIDDSLRIYVDEKSKKSISINLEIKNSPQEFIGKNYDIKNIDSLTINTALLLAPTRIVQVANNRRIILLLFIWSNFDTSIALFTLKSL